MISIRMGLYKLKFPAKLSNIYHNPNSPHSRAPPRSPATPVARMIPSCRENDSPTVTTTPLQLLLAGKTQILIPPLHLLI